jgi:hypothetical protein
MRFLGIVGVLAAGSWLAACGDGDASATVGDAISWKVTGQGVHASHTQKNVKQKFKVTCSRTSAGLNFTIEDPGYPGDGSGNVANAMRPGGVIEVRNANPGGGNCNVTVKDAESYGGVYISYIGACGASCTLNGGFGVQGWDFSGNLICNGLTIAGATGSAAMLQYGLVDAVNNGAAVQINLDNCD